MKHIVDLQFQVVANEMKFSAIFSTFFLSFLFLSGSYECLLQAVGHVLLLSSLLLFIAGERKPWRKRKSKRDCKQICRDLQLGLCQENGIELSP